MNFVSKCPINKGWSSDKKYCVTYKNGTRYLLRVSDIAEYDKKQLEFNMMQQVSALGVPMCQPIEFGTCNEGVYSIQSWIDGEDAEEIIPTLSDTEQYVYGLEAGRILRKIHSISAPATQEDWEAWFNRKMDYKINKYTECPLKYENGQAFIDYIFWNLAACNNLIYDPEMKVGDVIVSDSGKGELTFISNTEVCVTPAGTFENCLVFAFQGNEYGLTYCKTFICAGVGIVRQETEHFNGRHVLELSKVHIVSGQGIIPFAPGNRWDYSPATPDTAVQYDKEIFFEVTAFENNAATVAAAICCETLGYFDTFDGKMAEVIQNYYTGEGDNEKLVDVRESLQRAKELAVTKHQKTRLQVAENVMQRILITDPKNNPDYTEKGRWNFYSCGELTYKNGQVQWSLTEHFEWKDSVNLGLEGRKMLYSFFDEIVDSCGMGRWSDEWVPGFTAKPKNPLKEFIVLEDETVITPAGTFKNCRHISFDLNLNFYFGGKSECWYAEGIGFVKFTHKIDDNMTAVWQLTEYQGVGEGYFPFSDGLYRKYEPDIIGNGYRASLEYTFDSDENGTYIFRNATGVQNRRDYEATLSN